MNEQTPRLAVIGDVHAHFKRLDQVIERIREVGVDGILMVGDIACAGKGARTAKGLKRYRGRVRKVFETVRTLDVPICYVPGNHDLQNLSEPNNIDDRVVNMWGLRVGGLGGTNPPKRGFPYEWTDDQMRARPTLDVDILISHCPPANSPLDFARGAGRNVGSIAIRERVEKINGVMVCGHIHESAGLTQINDCLCMNAGGLGNPFGRTQVGFLFGTHTLRHEDLDSGVIQTLHRE
ncbi:MAG: metallophosphoesterase [Myxococcota bacterium]